MGKIICMAILGMILFSRSCEHSEAQDKGKADDIARRDLEKLQGIWFHKSREQNGKVVAGEDKESLLVVRGNTFVLKREMQVNQVGTLKIVDPTASPPQIDLIITDGPNEGITILAVYKINAGVFSYCGGVSTRPTKLGTANEHGVYCSTYRRKEKQR